MAALVLVAACDEPTEEAELSAREAQSAATTAVAAVDDAVERAGQSAREAVAVAEALPERERCAIPAIPIPRPRECERGRDYPQCKWQMPHATLSEGRYRRWRNTIMEHWWGRPALVGFILASTARYRERFPDQVLAIGDLDAPGPRHQTHDRGVDVDIYLPGAMLVENAGGGDYPSNHEGKTEAEVEATRQRVEGLARALAECASGAVRIYYNDPVVLERFHTWYDEQGFDPNPFGRPMQQHNHLHDFHFHISIPEELALLPMSPLPPGQRHPLETIEEPPDPESAPNLASRNRNTTWRTEMAAEAEANEPNGNAMGVAPSAMAPSPMAPSPMAPSPMGPGAAPQPSAMGPATPPTAETGAAAQTPTAPRLGVRPAPPLEATPPAGG